MDREGGILRGSGHVDLDVGDGYGEEVEFSCAPSHIKVSLEFCKEGLDAVL